MKILFLTTRYPFPPVGGDKLRAYNFIKYLIARGHEVHLLSLTDQDVELNDSVQFEKVIFLSRARSYLNSFLGLFSRKPLQVWYFHSKRFQQEVDTLRKENNYDLIFCHLFRTAEYVRKVNNIPKILDLTDAISLSYSRISRQLSKNFSILNLIYTFEKKRVISYEGKILRSFTRSILASEYDKKYLSKFFDVSNIEIIENGVNTIYFPFYDGKYNKNQIVFIGNMRTAPNIDAVLYFNEKIFPLVKKEIPEAKFFIVGAEPPKKIYDLTKKDKNIHVTGFVRNIRSYLKSAAVSVAPMRYSAGVQNKILESMAVGTPVVSTTIGMEGIHATPDKNIVIEDSPEQFAAKIVDLIKNGKLRKSISIAGRALVERKYTWEEVLEKLNILTNNLKNN